ncbi:MAG: hypothetical protein COA63_009870 [Methylophaga sp.]|nr:hypothetical protein [Methylophaga sp.]
MGLEEQITAAKVKKHKQLIKVVLGFIGISLLCALIVLYVSFAPLKDDEAELIASNSDTEIAQKSTSINPAPAIPDEQLRQTYIRALSNYENTLKPELNKIGLTKWDEARTQRLASLEDASLSKFSATDYAGAISSMEELTHLAQTMITDSQQEFEQALSKAQNAYDADQYNDARFQIATALMLDNTSIEAETLSNKIEQLPEILALLEQINTARVENKPNKELALIKELLKLAPERESAVKRKQILISRINNKNFKSYIAQSFQAIEQSNAGKAKQKISAAKKIFPNRQEIKDVELALQQLEKKQRLATHQQKAQIAMAADDWITAKQQLQLALKEQVDNKAMQASLAKATTIIALNNEFEQQIKKPYRLSNKQLASRMQAKINTASTLGSVSPSLDEKTKQLSQLIERMNTKIAVEIISDNQTNILVRGVGVVGQTSLKTIQLTPGNYTFEGKRKGYKSKLINVLIPYDKPTFSLSIYCDEPI